MLADGWHAQVTVDIDARGMITSVRSGISTRERTAQPCDWSCRHLLPAISNVHSHAFQRAMAGGSERIDTQDNSDFWSWRAQMYRLANTLAPEDIAAISSLAFMEMLEAGYAAVAEFHYLHHAADGRHYDQIDLLSQQIMTAAATTGIGLCLLPVLYAQADADGSPLLAQQRRFGNSLDDFLRLLQAADVSLRQLLQADARLGVAAHSLRAVSPTQLSGMVQNVQQQPIHMHIAEQTAELESVRRQLGAPPLQWLHEHVELDQGWCLIHATHATTSELQALAKTGCSIGLCPHTEANLGDGVFALPDWLSAGGHSGIGSDSNIRISVVEELRLLEYTHRLLQQRRQVLLPANCAGITQAQGEALYRHALRGGAQALQRHSGVIAPGHWADLLHLDGSHCGLDHLHADNLVDGWVFASGQNMVRDVWSAGRHCVVNGQHVLREQIQREYRATVQRLAARQATTCT